MRCINVRVSVVCRNVNCQNSILATGPGEARKCTEVSQRVRERGPSPLIITHLCNHSAEVRNPQYLPTSEDPELFRTDPIYQHSQRR